MSRPDPSASPRRPANGRRVALLVLAVAFVASATTAMLAFHASHRAQRADEVAVAADESDLRAVLSEWQAQVRAVDLAPSDRRAMQVLSLPERLRSLSTWRPRSPCGEQARDRLGDAMRDRVRWIERREAGTPGGTEPDEARVLATTLRDCKAAQGRDVTI